MLIGWNATTGYGDIFDKIATKTIIVAITTAYDDDDDDGTDDDGVSYLVLPLSNPARRLR